MKRIGFLALAVACILLSGGGNGSYCFEKSDPGIQNPPCPPLGKGGESVERNGDCLEKMGERVERGGDSLEKEGATPGFSGLQSVRGDIAGCLKCHSEHGMTGHSGSCVDCHGGHGEKPEKAEAHQGMSANPADFTNTAFACGRCHEEQARQANRTLMATAAGIINQTRFLWGAQDDEANRYAAREIDGIKALPTGEESAPLVDDLLRRRCLRCHLGARDVPSPAGLDTAAVSGGHGCAACHVLDGNGIGPDQKATDSGPHARTQGHQLTTAIPTSQCLKCHNGNRIGADYAGLFERDLSSSYNFAATDPDSEPRLMKHSYHYLLPDIHYERGMQCIDCHPVEELMGEGKIHAQSKDQVRVRCADCHGLPGKPPRTRPVAVTDVRALRAAKVSGRYDLEPGQRVIETSGGHLLTNTMEKEGVFLLTSKIDGRVHRIPVLGKEASGAEPLNHRIPGHMDRMECTACHAAWTFQDFGLHLMRLDSADYEPWERLTRQSDLQARRNLESNLSKPREQWDAPTSRDWLTGLSGTGVWLEGYSMRRWEGRILGVNSRGLVSIMRPHYQYWVSWVDSQGKIRMDSVIPRSSGGRPALAWDSYAPHTIRRQTAACSDCHGNARALGLGRTEHRAKDDRFVGLENPLADGLGIDFDVDRVIDENGRPIQTVGGVGAGFLNKGQLEKMSAQNPIYIKYLLEYFEGKEAYGDPAGFTGPSK